MVNQTEPTLFIERNIYGDCVQILLLLEEKYMRASLGILIPVKERKKKCL